MPDTVIQTDSTVASSTIEMTAPASSLPTKKEIKNQINADVEASVKEYFKDIPVMAKVAFCESTYTQFSAPGTVHRGVVNNKDVGIFQINEKYHLKDSKDMGMDIYSIEGNMEYARVLYEKQGLQPWSASKPCWGKNTEIATR
jgi:delta-aminolevulinic acid dehydratase/porphobilinogen synthase